MGVAQKEITIFHIFHAYLCVILIKSRQTSKHLCSLYFKTFNFRSGDTNPFDFLTSTSSPDTKLLQLDSLGICD